jgi:hypothetical protein
MCKGVKGAYILTKDGYKLIEDLTLNDIIITHSKKETKIIKIEIDNALGNTNTYHSIIRKGTYNAFADLFISKGHSLFINNEFVPASNLGLEEDVKKNFVYKYYSIMTEDYLNDTIKLQMVL